MKHSTFITVASSISLMALPQSSLAENWIGVFTTENVSGCAIEGPGELVTVTRYGYGKFGLDYDFGILDDLSSSAISTPKNTLKEEAEVRGKNAVIGTRLEVSQSSSPVFSSGQNWRDGDGKRFEYTASYIVATYGTAVTLKCQ